jgi:predicted nucleic acid-binding protein
LAYLFDTDAISELLRSRPLLEYVRWVRTLARAEQFTSAVVVGELYQGAFRSSAAARHIANIEKRILPAVTVIPYDIAVAREFGRLQADLRAKGRVLADCDAQIAATALQHDLELVTGNIRHFARVPALRINGVLAEARSARD